MHPNLSVELGVRYQYAPPIYTQGNNVVNFDPALYDPAHGGAHERQRHHRAELGVSIQRARSCG